MEHIVTDVNTVIAALADLSAELQRSIQPGHPNAERFAMAQAEHRQAHRDPGANHPVYHAPGNAPAPAPAPGNAPVNEWNHPHNMAYPWAFEGRNYLRAGEYIYEVPLAPNANIAEVFVGRYLPAERRINRNAEEPDFD